MFERTQDPYVIIVHREPDFLIYYCYPMEQSWIIYGNCTHNGSCVDGAINPDLRPYNERLDCPVRPEIDCQGCNIRGVYI